MTLLIQVAAGASEGDLHITVRLRNYSGLPGKTLMEAEREASRVLEEAGIASDWLECSITRGPADRTDSCGAPVGPTDLSINILSGQMMRHLSLQPETLGVAMLPPAQEDAFAREAVVCSSRVKEFVMEQGREMETGELKSAMLGSVMAHELGHLLGIRRHSALGVMHVVWSQQEMTMAQQGRLLFTADEKRVIQEQVRKRQIAACAARSSRNLLAASTGQ